MGDSAIDYVDKSPLRVRCLICHAWIGDRIPSCIAGVCLNCVRAMPCWRCGEAIDGFWPYLLCEPCVDVVSDDDIAWLNDPMNQPEARTWEMKPLGKSQGGVV